MKISWRKFYTSTTNPGLTIAIKNIIVMTVARCREKILEEKNADYSRGFGGGDGEIPHFE